MHPHNTPPFVAPSASPHANWIGAGACDEIPLDEIATRFDQVTLNDVEPLGVEAARARIALPK